MALIKINICQSFFLRFKFVRPRLGSLLLADVTHFVVPWGQAKENFVQIKFRTHNFSGSKISYGPRGFSGPKFCFKPKKNQNPKKLCVPKFSGPTFFGTVKRYQFKKMWDLKFVDLNFLDPRTSGPQVKKICLFVPPTEIEDHKFSLIHL